MTKNCTSALIVAGPGPLRDGLQALMAAMPQIEIVEQVDDVSSALRMNFERCPALVLLDSGLAGREIWITVRRIKSRWPQARCICLADDVRQQREVEAAGADAVLLKGFPAARLVVTIVRLLPRRGEQGKDDSVAVSTPRHGHRVRRWSKQHSVIL